MAVDYNGATYYYATNLQGDIVAILNSAGAKVVTYTYDAWGNILSIGGTLANTLGVHNPLRYRGYVYDTEIGLYYLQSRYYDPELGRFINADALVATGQGLLGNNMFAYCGNNPVNCADPSGNSLIWILALYGAIQDFLALANYVQNSYADSIEATSTYGKIVNDQNGVTGESFVYGLYKAKHNACEAISVHNVKVALGIESTLSDTMLDFQSANAMLGMGFFGSNPYAIGDVLENDGIPYTRVGLEDLDRPGIYILSYWTGTPWQSPLHTVAVQYDGVQYVIYNRSGNGTLSYGIPTNSDNFICGYYVGGAS